MSIMSLILYGSCARKDDDESSDVDILALSDDSTYHSNSHNKMNISVYPLEMAMTRAREGDLFMLHIAQEGVEIYDRNRYLKAIKSVYKYKESYKDEINNASELGWFILNWINSISDFSLVNRRIAWCVRTILIAKSAEQRTPVFSAASLVRFSRRPEYIHVIKVKNNKERDDVAVSLFREFLLEFGSEESKNTMMPSMSDQKAYFISRGNAIAEKTAESFMRNVFSSMYS